MLLPFIAGLTIYAGRAARIIAALLVLSVAANAAGTPPQLYGKSVVVTWLVEREQTYEGETHPGYQTISFNLEIYISSAGRSFSKLSQSANYRGSTTPGSSEQGPSDSAAIKGGSRVVHFEAGSLIMDTKMESGARRIIVRFDGDYTSCTARVIYGKEGGAPTIRHIGALSGRRMEIHSTKTSAVNCSIRDGNAFGG